MLKGTQLGRAGLAASGKSVKVHFNLSNPQSPNQKSLVREEDEAQKSVTSTRSLDEYDAKLDSLSPGPLRHSISEMHFMTT